MCIENHADFPRLLDKTSDSSSGRQSNELIVSCLYLNGRGKDTGTSTIDMAKTCKKETTRGLNFCKDRKHESRSTDAGLKS